MDRFTQYARIETSHEAFVLDEKLHFRHSANKFVTIMGCVSLALLTATVLATPAAAGSRQDATILLPENAEQRASQVENGYSQAVITDGIIYLSGVVARAEPGDPNLEAAYQRTYSHLGTILKRAGASWDDVIDITTFHTDVTTQMGPISVVHKRFVKSPYPTWTAIGITRLIPDTGLTEIKLVARLPKQN